MIPASLKALIDATHGQRHCKWAGRDIWLANEDWGQLAVSLQGAQVLHYLPASKAAQAAGASSSAPESARVGDAVDSGAQEPLIPGGWLWVTPTPQQLPGAIRGGIPLCWPWFADENTADESPDRSGPMHGPVRRADWHLDAVDEHEEGVELHLSLPERFHSQLHPRAVIQANAQRLHVELITEHVGDTPVKMTAALHSYLAVDQVFACRVEGLAGARYLDKLKDFDESEQQGELGVRSAIDRIYHSNAEVILDDGQRRLRIARHSSDSAVIWNPGDTPPPDTPPEAARRFLCVEAANTRLDPVWLVPGAQHMLATTISLAD
ncbi:D-hexose-6-phosphate mutarotase [Halomonas binhaiensis]|uniref:D-hexose-6-phosphate mutarotase n=1 Tax=Halomonas binhaiensis TaxID=2562282 RepID=A0A5C1NEX8_9GAMM|nr:D-hexose-6-phosphate mutarotase [Halomonas binhaiensis]QEM80815.1 D-hexose-6-phosphate mutarotase [Halomonas binhaiensis]